MENTYILISERDRNGVYKPLSIEENLKIAVSKITALSDPNRKSYMHRLDRFEISTVPDDFIDQINKEVFGIEE